MWSERSERSHARSSWSERKLYTCIAKSWHEQAQFPHILMVLIFPHKIDIEYHTRTNYSNDNSYTVEGELICQADRSGLLERFGT